MARRAGGGRRGNGGGRSGGSGGGGGRRGGGGATARVPMTMLNIQNIKASLASIRHMDKFGYIPSYRYYKYRSAGGAFMTMVVIFFSLVYILSTFRTFLDQEHIVSREQREFIVPPLPAGASVTETIEVFRNAWLPVPDFAIVFELEGEAVDDPNLFNWEFDLVMDATRDGVRENIRTIALQSDQCTTQFLNEAGDNVMVGARCITPGLQDAGLYGTSQDDLFSYIRVRMVRCDGAVVSLCPANTLEVDETVYAGSVRLALRTEDADGTFVNMFQRELVQDVQLSSNLIFQRVNSTRKPIYVVDGASHEYITFAENDETFAGFNNERGVYATWFLRLSRLEVREVRQVETLLGLFATWGAMYAFMYLVVGSLARKWNEQNFDIQLGDRDLRTLDREHFSMDGHLLLETSMMMPAELRLMTATPSEGIQFGDPHAGKGAGGPKVRRR